MYNIIIIIIVHEHEMSLVLLVLKRLVWHSGSGWGRVVSEGPSWWSRVKGAVMSPHLLLSNVSKRDTGCPAAFISAAAEDNGQHVTELRPIFGMKGLSSGLSHTISKNPAGVLQTAVMQEAHSGHQMCLGRLRIYCKLDFSINCWFKCRKKAENKKGWG